MKAFDRFATLLRADVHGVLDQLEERSLLLKQHLREAEVEVACGRARLETLDEERQRLADDAARLEARVRELDEDVELALAGDDTELARFAVRRLLPQRQALAELQARGTQLGEQRQRLAERLRAQESRLAALRPRVRSELARSARTAGIARDPGAPLADALASDEEVELELLRRARADRDGSGNGSETGGAR